VGTMERLVVHELRRDTGCAGEAATSRMIRSADGPAGPAHGLRIAPHGLEKIIERAIRG